MGSDKWVRSAFPAPRSRSASKSGKVDLTPFQVPFQVQASDGFCTQNFPPVISMQVPVMNEA